MSTVPQAALVAQEGDYMPLFVLTAVGYDYLLTFSKEVEYIWSKPWTWVSTLFIFVRYLGFFSLIIPTLMGSSLRPGPAKVFILRCKVFVIIYEWSLLLFLCSADIVMILRVWVMYHRSRLIISTLLGLLFLEAISMLLAAAIYSDPKNLPVTTIQILDVSLCVSQNAPYPWTYATTILQVVLGAAMCILVIARFVRQSIQIYYATKQWQFNRYINLIVKEGILYFFGIFLYNLVHVLFILRKVPLGKWQMTLLCIMEFVPMYTLPPRFIMSIRELCASDVWGGHSRGGIDSGFGLSSTPGRGTVGTQILFAAVKEDEEPDGVEEIPMEAGIILPPA